MPRLTQAPLTRERIVTAALALLDEGGLAGLTTRRLADALGVRQPALYWHFRDVRALLDAVADAMISPEDWPEPDGSLSPPEWLAGRAHAFRRALLAHRDGALVHAGTRPDPAAARHVEQQLSALIEAGLTPEAALRLLLAVSRYTVGWVLEEQAEAARGSVAEIGVAEGETPVLAAAQRNRDADAEFNFGLRALIAGALQG